MDFRKFAAFFPCFAFFSLVKYSCKVTSSVCLQRAFTAVHKAMPACMPEESLAIWQSDESQYSARWGSTPLRTSPVRLSRVRIPPYVGRAYASGFGKLPETVQLRECITIALPGAMHHRPCPKTDTVYQIGKPKVCLSACPCEH